MNHDRTIQKIEKVPNILKYKPRFLGIFSIISWGPGFGLYADHLSFLLQGLPKRINLNIGRVLKKGRLIRGSTILDIFEINSGGVGLNASSYGNLIVVDTRHISF